MTTKTVAAKVRKLLIDLEITQTELAKRLGVHKQVLANWLNGSRNIQKKGLAMISKATGKPLSYFLSGDSDAAIGDITGDNNIGHNNKGAVNNNN
ncbi:MAG: helix-turn-helix transcriptional regulator, partial [Elusimicrobiota bacterium]|nr:helix-turn-helix transcriptional regulator [Elusimicrobiota bacterium]